MARAILEVKAVTKRFGMVLTADELSLTVNQGEFFTFLGPSGSGKSTILRMVAGLETPDSGQILIDGQDVSAVPPWQRNLGMMFQQYAVFPHMTVAENVGYGLKVRRMSGDTIKQRVDEMLELVGLSGYRDKNVTLLSGGEQQRVALARALAPQPRMLLLDEPLSALDEKIRRAMQAELKHVHSKTGTTFLYVTHDQEEALTMSDRIAVFERGVCVQCDEPEPLYKRPRTRFVAGFFRGCNVLTAERVVKSNARATLRLAGMAIEGMPIEDGACAAVNHIALRAENIHIGPEAACRACKGYAVLIESIYRGTVIDYRLELPDGQQLLATTTRHMDLPNGCSILVGFDADAIIPLAD
jgi:ABC-type Fe3+/spermidine/putrescine transport system ATPase subunit